MSTETAKLSKNTIELVSGPAFLNNNSSTWPQTKYNMFMSLSNNLAGEDASNAAFEMQAKAIVYACLGSKGFQFIKNRWHNYYVEIESADISKNDDAIRNDIWLRIAGEAIEIDNKRTSGDGYMCKTAVTWIPEGVEVKCLPPTVEDLKPDQAAKT
jgi:hypothetical protein